MGKRPRDNQRMRLYNAEQYAWDLLPPPRIEHVAAMQAFADRVTGSAWWMHHVTYNPRRIRVKDGRGRRRGAGGGRIVKMPRWTRQLGYLVHELAHCAQTARYGWRSTAWHGPKFCALYLSMVREFMGPDHAAALSAGYVQNRVKVDWAAANLDNIDEAAGSPSETPHQTTRDIMSKVTLKKLGTTKYEVHQNSRKVGVVFRTRRTFDGKQVQGYTYDGAPDEFITTGAGARDRAVAALLRDTPAAPAKEKKAPKAKAKAAKKAKATRPKTTVDKEAPGAVELVQERGSRFAVELAGERIGSIYYSTTTDKNRKVIGPTNTDTRDRIIGWTHTETETLWTGKGAKRSALADLVATAATEVSH